MNKTATAAAASIVAGTTEAEAAILASTAAAIAAGQDPFGDDDDDTVPAAEAKDDDNDTGDDAADDAADEGDKASDKADPEALSADALAAVAGDEEDGEKDGADATPAAEAVTEAPTAPRFKGIDPAKYKTERAAIVAEKAKGLKDLMEGTIEPEAYSALVDAADEKLEALTVARTLHEANVQSEAQTQTQVLDKIMRAAKADGIDYAADGKAARRFDAEMALMDADGDKRSYAERAADAHKAVAAVLGKPKPKADAEPAKEAPKPRENGKGPVTLRNVPAAEVPNNGGSWIDAIGKLSGQDYEAAYAKLTPAQKAELLND